MNYSDFLAGKLLSVPPTGLESAPELNPKLFPFQRDLVRWALLRGRAAIWADCGLGKTPMQLEWATKLPCRVLILAPLAVAGQTVREGRKFGINVKYARTMADAGDEKIVITNYQMLDMFDASQFDAVVLDESSILKSFEGATRNQIIETFSKTRFKLACTATPAPNDYMEIGNHAEFLNVCTRTEMLATYFVHDGGETQNWRLKGHAESEYWKWLSEWAVMMRKPSDLGYKDDKFVLPELIVSQSVVESTVGGGAEHLFEMPAASLQERISARRNSTPARVEECAKLVNGGRHQWLIWCNLNTESEQLAAAIPDAVEVRGSDSNDEKEKAMASFSNGETRVLVTKPSIAGFGMNWQNCHNVAFVGLSDSYEQFYQAVRRCWRFGQKNKVNCHLITASTEGAVVANIQRKEADSKRMAENMVEHMKDLNRANIAGAQRQRDEYN